MKKISLILLSTIMLAACGTEQGEQAENSVNGTSGEASTEETVESTEEETVEETVQEPAAVEEATGLKVYMPSEGLEKQYKVDSIELGRRVLEVKDDKVLEEITFGDVKAVQITEWSENEMHMLFDTGELEGVSNISIDALVPTSEPILMIDESNTTAGEWLVVSTDETLQLPAGTFENVLVIEQVLKTETSEQVTTFTQYYAPELGFVKEKTAIVNGTDEQVSEVELVSFQ